MRGCVMRACALRVGVRWRVHACLGMLGHAYLPPKQIRSG